MAVLHCPVNVRFPPAPLPDRYTNLPTNALLRLRFIQTDGPVILRDCPELLDYLSLILPFWDYGFEPEPQVGEIPFLTISKQGDDYFLEGPYLPQPTVSVACAVSARPPRSGWLKPGPKSALGCHTPSASTLAPLRGRCRTSSRISDTWHQNRQTSAVAILIQRHLPRQ